MGKIFDALEKADKHAQPSGPVYQLPPKATPAEVSEDLSQDEKVMPFAGATLNKGDMRLSQNLVTFHTPQSIEADLFKVLRTNLLFPAEGTPPKSILVTSAVPGDGKSFVSSNLAISIAQGIEEFVLLVDCDIRRPSLHTYFGFGKVNGLSSYLDGSDPIEKLLLKSPISKLSILPGGRPPRNPTELLSSRKMRGLLDEITRRYDDRYIIIDSPPPSMAAEVTAIAQSVDGVILVVRSGKTPRQAVHDTVERIGKAKILGIVLNQAEQSVKKYYGYDKSYYRE
jgi:protein-tyrosine kinase